MELEFIIFSVLSIISSLGIIFNSKKIVTIIYFLIFIISISCLYFSLGMYFVGSLEMIVYSHTIIVILILFFMLVDKSIDVSKLKLNYRIFSYIISLLMFSFLFYSIYTSNYDINPITQNIIHDKDIGNVLFKEYFIVVELSSILLIAALVIILHLLTNNKKNNL